MAAYLFRIQFGIRIAVTKKMANVLEKLFTKVPVSILPDPCFDTSGIFDSNRLIFKKMYEKFNARASDHPLSQWKPFESNIKRDS
ncbi:hypothetical protein Avbf_17074 [Armadillidium vulgare]|nr:hypothetical protein Avbf_17074 [Armadillidium vulgare]